MTRLSLICLTAASVSGCVPPDDFQPKTNALKQAQALSVYEEGLGKRRARDYDDAIRSFDKAIELDLNFAEAFLARGDAQTEKKNYAAALSDFDQLLKLAPAIASDRESTYIFRDMAVCHTALKQWSKVLDDCDKMLALNGRYSFAYMARAIAYQGLKQPEKAREAAAKFEALKHPLKN